MCVHTYISYTQHVYIHTHSCQRRAKNKSQSTLCPSLSLYTPSHTHTYTHRERERERERKRHTHISYTHTCIHTYRKQLVDAPLPEKGKKNLQEKVFYRQKFFIQEAAGGHTLAREGQKTKGSHSTGRSGRSVGLFCHENRSLLQSNQVSFPVIYLI